MTDAGKYIWDLNDEQKLDMQQRAKEMLMQTRTWFSEGIDILILDEIMAAIKYDIVSLADVLSLLDARPDGCEVILTGRDAPNELKDRGAPYN